MVTSNAIVPSKAHGDSAAQSQLILIHITERQSLIGFLATQGLADLNMFVAVTTVSSFMLLIASFLLRKRSDALTGVYARDIIENDLPRIIREAVASKKDACLILADIDHFKKVNDTYGHMIGDVVLKEFADIIKQMIRNKDWVARYGGEEFIIFLPDTDIENGTAVAERIRERLETASVIADEKTINVTASFGVSSLMRDNVDTARELIKTADKNLYAAKNTGRNRVR